MDFREVHFCGGGQIFSCRSEIKGRADKKFCDDYCRNNYNNQLNSDTSNYVRNVNNILRRNRRILEETMEGVEKATARSKAELAKKGYRFDFFTSIFTHLLHFLFGIFNCMIQFLSRFLR